MDLQLYIGSTQNKIVSMKLLAAKQVMHYFIAVDEIEWNGLNDHTDQFFNQLKIFKVCQ